MCDKRIVISKPWEDSIFIGQKRDEYKTGIEGAVFNISQNGMTLALMLPNITNKELYNYINGSFEMKIVLINGFIWFTFQFAKQGWEDAPFAIQLASIPDIRDYKKLCDKLIILIIDTVQGQVMSMSYVTLNEGSKEILFRYIDQTMATDFDEPVYRSFTSEVKSQCTPEKIASNSFFFISCD